MAGQLAAKVEAEAVALGGNAPGTAAICAFGNGVTGGCAGVVSALAPYRSLALGAVGVAGGAPAAGGVAGVVAAPASGGAAASLPMGSVEFTASTLAGGMAAVGGIPAAFGAFGSPGNTGSATGVSVVAPKFGPAAPDV